MHKPKSIGRALTLLLPMLLLTACATKPNDWPLPPAKPAAIPALPPQARQPEPLPWCSPTCSAGWKKQAEAWQKQLTEAE